MSAEILSFSDLNLKEMPSSLGRLEPFSLIQLLDRFLSENFLLEFIAKFSLQQLEVEWKNGLWKKNSEITNSFAKEIYTLKINFSSIQEEAYFLVSKHDLKTMLESFLQIPQSNDLIHEEFLKGFLLFVGYEIISISQKSLTEKQSIRLELTSIDDLTLAFTRDLEIKINNNIFLTRFIFPENFVNNCTALKKSTLWKESSLAKLIPLELSFEIGKVALKQQEWQKVKIGDFILLDSCTFDPNFATKSALMLVQNIPFYQGTWSEKGFTIKNRITFEEVNSMIDKKFGQDDDEEEEDFKGFNFDIDDEDDDDDDEDEEDDFLFEEDEETKKRLRELQKDLQNVGQDEEEEQQSSNFLASETEASPSSIQSVDAKTGELENIPLQVVVEVSRVHMNLDKVLELQPGTVLDLHKPLEPKVILSINGKKVAQGELLKLGENLGVRITEIE
ncbi:MAG: hypothetical protein BGO10_04330 [Chlamydia sp. 32-24]|nr:MAG: hypothetical protein BGO10_04330 [Chlamydia sp. 32-24]